MPMGPRGAAMARPSNRPLNRNTIPQLASTVKGPRTGDTISGFVRGCPPGAHTAELGIWRMETVKNRVKKLKAGELKAGEMAQFQPPALRAVAMKLVTDCDLLRLKVIARLHGRSLPPDMSWQDLLQEAFTRVLDGSRAIPPGVPTVAFLAGVMRSIKAEHWRRRRRDTEEQPALVNEYQ